MRPRGFTLIEVMVSLAILALSMGVLLQANVTTIASVDRIDGMTQATLLGRSKMLDIERKLYKEGFKADCEEMNGAFEDEGHSDIKWTAKICPVKMQTEKLGEMAQQFAGFGAALGGSGASNGGTPTKDAKAPAKSGSTGGSSDLSKLDAGDPLAMIRPMLEPVTQAISQNLRFVKLDVSWPEGIKRRGSFSVTAMITSKAMQQSQQALTGQAGNNTAGGTTNGVQNPTTPTTTSPGGAATGATTGTASTTTGGIVR